jgi:hypothetical protein
MAYRSGTFGSSFSGGRCGGRCPGGRKLHPIKTGVYPYVVQDLLNFQSVYLYFTITIPVVDGVQTRTAWLVPPTIILGETPVPTIRIMTYCDQLGCDSPQSAKVETSNAGIGLPIPRSSACSLEVFNPAYNGGTWFLGCSSDPTDGTLIYAPTSCVGAEPTDSAFVFDMAFPNPSLVNLTTGNPMLASTITTGRVLRAVPTKDPTAFTLAWLPVSSPVGFNVTVTFVSKDCGPCPGGSDDPTFPPVDCLDL